MKILKTASYKKIATKYNPWAVCHTTVDKEKDPAAFERCVHHIKDQNRESKDCSLGDTKPIGEGEIYTPEKEDDWVSQNKGRLHRHRNRQTKKPSWDDILNKMRKVQPQEVLADSNFTTIADVRKEAKEKWIQDAVEKPGSFTAYCKDKGYDGVTQECINEGKKSSDPTTKRRAELAETFRGMKKKKKD